LSTFGVVPALIVHSAFGVVPSWYVRSVTPGSCGGVVCAAAVPVSTASAHAAAAPARQIPLPNFVSSLSVP
jgi:hypothetical protein